MNAKPIEEPEFKGLDHEDAKEETEEEEQAKDEGWEEGREAPKHWVSCRQSVVEVFWV